MRLSADGLAEGGGAWYSGLSLGRIGAARADVWVVIARMVWRGARGAQDGSPVLGWGEIAGADTWTAIVRMIWWEAGGAV